MMEKGGDVLRQLKKSKGLTPEQQKWLDGIEADLRDTETQEKAPDLISRIAGEMKRAQDAQAFASGGES